MRLFLFLWDSIQVGILQPKSLFTHIFRLIRLEQELRPQSHGHRPGRVTWLCRRWIGFASNPSRRGCCLFRSRRWHGDPFPEFIPFSSWNMSHDTMRGVTAGHQEEPDSLQLFDRIKENTLIYID